LRLSRGSMFLMGRCSYRGVDGKEEKKQE